MARKFAKGVLGVAIVIVAIMGTVLGGFALSTTDAEITETKYDYVTDVSGLFEYSKVPQFVEYNPATNWTGYHEVGSDDFGGITLILKHRQMLLLSKQNRNLYRVRS